MTIAFGTAASAARERGPLTAPARVLPPLFVPIAAVLSVVNRSRLRAWGWAPLDHHGVPWPSSLALLPGGRLQVLNFAGSGVALIALGAALPRGPRSRLLMTCGTRLLAAALPLDPPQGDPAALTSWVRSWHAAVHAGGFLVAGPAGVLAIVSSRRRGDAVVAALLAGAAVARTPGWYAFLGGFFTWVWLLARGAAGDAPTRRARRPIR